MGRLTARESAALDRHLTGSYGEDQLGDETDGAAELRGRLHHAVDIRRFIEAGNATLTVVSKKTGARFTFKFSRPPEAPGKARPIWVKVLTGDDNESSYAFIGTLWPLHEYEVRRSTASKVSEDAPSSIALAWLLFHLYHRAGKSRAVYDQAEVWHEGRCGRCGRKLTVPESIASGFGPECIQHVGGDRG